MRRVLAVFFSLLVTGCDVQLGRDPKNTFTFDTDLSGEKSPAQKPHKSAEEHFLR